jgi:hypothetical protein
MLEETIGMKCFPEMKTWEPLFHAVQNQQPIVEDEALFNEFKEYLLFFQSRLPIIRDRSTGRLHTFNSTEANEHFGLEIGSVMHGIINRLSNEMISTKIINTFLNISK